MQISKSFILAVFLAFSVFALTAETHGLGQTIEKKIGVYTIDIDIDARTVRVGDSVRINLNLIDDETIEGPNFDNIWVRLEKGRKTIFAGGISKSEIGPTGLTTVFPEAGTHTISVRFQNGTEKIVEAEADFEVEESARATNSSFLGFLLTAQFGLGILIGLILGFLIKQFMPMGNKE